MKNEVGTASWVLIIVAIVVNVMLRKTAPALTDMVVLAIVVAAMVCGVVGLVQSVRKKSKRAGSIVGIVLSALLLLIFASNYFAR